MRVLLCVNSDIGRGNTIGFRFTHIAEELTKRHIAYDIIARANYDRARTVITPWYSNILARGLNAIRIYLWPRLEYRSVEMRLFDRFVLRTLKKQGQEYTVAHIGECIPETILYLKSKGTKVVLDIPIGHPAYALQLQQQGIQVAAEEIVIPKPMTEAVRLANHLITPSTFVADTLRIAHVTTPSTVIPFGADVRRGLTGEEIRTKTTGISKLQFIFAGNVNQRKGIPYLLQAWRMLNVPNAELVICGRLFKEIKDQIKNEQYTNVRFLGFVDLNTYLRDAHVFVFPTLLEGSAKAVYEAMSYGLPIITTPNAGSIVEDGKSGFIIPIADTKSLAERMKFLYDHREKITEMGLAARQLVEKYTWEEYGKKVVEIYER